MSWRVGIDSGGTFTDVVAVDERSGKVASVKVPSVPSDPSLGVLEGIRKICRINNITPGNLKEVVHGTTVATNAIIQAKLGNIGLITTKGHRDVLEIARQTVPGAYGNIVWWMKPDRIVALHNVREATERLNSKGNVLVPLDEDEAREIAHWFKRVGIKAIAVCLLHSYVNPSHEARIKEIFAEEYPECAVALSSDVVAEFREYERTVTTCINAGLIPLTTDYIMRMAKRLNDDGFRGPLLIMRSNGGVTGTAEIVKIPVSMALSGPAAGVAGSIHAMDQAGYRDFISLDIGGTSADVCRVSNGMPSVTTESQVAEAKIKLPMIDINTIGAGGGSIAWVAAGKALRVGPQSAGAEPGPACYGKGGAAATVTDAELFLGRLPSHLLGGEIALDLGKAETAIRRIAGELGLDPIETASGILRITTENMCNAIRQVSIRQGVDPRDYHLLAFGGAGALFGADVMDELDMPGCIIPPTPGAFSSSGLLMTDVMSDFIRTDTQSSEGLDVKRVEKAIAELEAEATAFLEREEVIETERKLIRSVDIRYEGQGYEVRTDFPSGRVTKNIIDKVVKQFNVNHERLYGFAYTGSSVEFVTWRVLAIGVRKVCPLQEISAGERDPAKARKESKKVFFKELGGFEECETYDRDLLLSGNVIDGPAIVDEYDSTVVITPGHKAEVDRFGNLIIRRSGNGRA